MPDYTPEPAKQCPWRTGSTIICPKEACELWLSPRAGFTMGGCSFRAMGTLIANLNDRGEEVVNGFMDIVEGLTKGKYHE